MGTGSIQDHMHTRVASALPSPSFECLFARAWRWNDVTAVENAHDRHQKLCSVGASTFELLHGRHCFSEKLFFLTHVDERAPAACRREERGKSARALRRIDSWTRSADLGVSVCTATDETPLLSLPVPPLDHHRHRHLSCSERCAAASVASSFR